MGEAIDLKFVVEDDDGNRSIVAVEPGEVLVGRAPSCSVCLTDRNVSRRHVRLQLDAAGNGSAEDLGSYNGVLVNGARIDGKVAFRTGDVLRVGDVDLTLQRGAPEALGEEATVNQGRALGAESTQPEGKPVARPLADEQTLPDGGARPMANEQTEPGEHAPAPTAGQAPTPPYAKLLCLGPPRLGVAFELTRADTVVGRTPDNHVVIDHPSISRQHAIVRYSAQTFRLIDAGSVNGIYVNGKSANDAVLRYGDVVELGQVKLRLLGPSEVPQLSAAEQAQALAQARTTPGGLARRIRSAATLSVAAGCIIGGALWVRGRMAPPAATNVPHIAQHLAEDDAPAAGDEEAQSLLGQAQAAFEAHQFARAGALANAVLVLDPKDPKGTLRRGAQAIAARAGAEGKGEEALDAATKAAAAHSWADAFNALQDVPPGCSQEAKARELLAQVRPALVKDRLAEAKESAEGHDWDEAQVLLQEVETLDPEAPGLDELRKRVAEARRPAAGAPAGAKSAAGAAAKLQAGKKADAVGHAAAKGAPTERRGAQVSTEDAKAIYAEGTRALGQGQIQRAIDSFNRCLVADKAYALCYRALGIAYAKGGSGAKAARFYRLYLKVDPNARDAAQVRTLLQQYATQGEGVAGQAGGTPAP